MRFAVITTATGLTLAWLNSGNVLSLVQQYGAINGTVAAVRPGVVAVLPYTVRQLTVNAATHMATFGLPGGRHGYVWWGNGEAGAVVSAYYRMCNIARCIPTVTGSAHAAGYTQQ